MPDTAIKVQDLSKKYRLNQRHRERYYALRDLLGDGLGNFSRRCFAFATRQGGAAAPLAEEFYALRELDFLIRQGDRVGIMGRNGAGKSTLLKILSRITEPSGGRVEIRGRVASLLEVGTGFHPELTGRENIFLNGAILGMGRAEIRRKFDEIVDFAEVEKFLDLPVKRYSSGMYVRLAFAVAAHLEPEILIVDEVLAVGDAQFQKKCLGKMEEVGGEGRTVLFVSHNMCAIQSICRTGILLEAGEVTFLGTAEKAAHAYLHSGCERFSVRSWGEGEPAPGNAAVRLRSVRVINAAGETAENHDIRHPIGIEMSYEVREAGHILWFGYNLYDGNNNNIFDTHSVTSEWYDRPHPTGVFSSAVSIPGNFLAEGPFYVGCAIFNHNDHVIYFHEQGVVSFNVIDYLEEPSARGKSTGTFPGIMRPLLKWETCRLSDPSSSHYLYGVL